MKNILHISLVSVLLFLVCTINAQSLIAVQNGTNSIYYASLDSAITNASVGSTIYIPGGSFTLSKTINKELHIVGVGHNPDSCTVTGITQVIGSFTIKSGSNHGSLTGLKISGGITFSVGTSDPVLDYFSIERCNIGGSISLATQSSNILINECIIRGYSISGGETLGFQMSKCIIENCVITNFKLNTYFINNIFINITFYTYSLVGVHYAFFKNNIFLSPISEYYSNISLVSGSQFQNNLFNLGYSTSSSSTNLHRNDITGPVSTLFVNQTGTVFDYKQDYHILPSSPAHNAGTDGTDLGIYGTGTPWKEGSLPGNPHIQSSSISTVNGNLNVKIKVASQDN